MWQSWTRKFISIVQVADSLSYVMHSFLYIKECIFRSCGSRVSRKSTLLKVKLLVKSVWHVEGHFKACLFSSLIYSRHSVWLQEALRNGWFKEVKIKQSQQEDAQTLQHAVISLQTGYIFILKNLGCYYVRFAVVGRWVVGCCCFFFQNCRNANKELNSHVTAPQKLMACSHHHSLLPVFSPPSCTSLRVRW